MTKPLYFDRRRFIFTLASPALITVLEGVRRRAEEPRQRLTIRPSC